MQFQAAQFYTVYSDQVQKHKSSEAILYSFMGWTDFIIIKKNIIHWKSSCLFQV